MNPIKERRHQHSTRYSAASARQGVHLGVAKLVGEDGDTIYCSAALEVQLQLLWCARVVDIAHVY